MGVITNALHQLFHFSATPKKSKLNNAPPKLIKKGGPKNVPITKLPTNTRNSDTQTAQFQLYKHSASIVTTLANPGLIPGNGEGIALSAICIIIASAANPAMTWSSRVVFICVVLVGSAFRLTLLCPKESDKINSLEIDTVVSWVGACYLHANRVWQACRYFAGLH